MKTETLQNYVVHMKQQGYGGTGRIYFGYDSISGREVAVKKMADVRKAEHEAWVMKSYGSHESLAQFIDFFIQDNAAYIVMERIHGKALARQETRKAIRITINLLKGLHYLHSQHFLHGDIAPPNVLLLKDSDEQIKIIDFGGAVRRGPDGLFWSNFRHGRYMPPPAAATDESADVHAAACVCLYMMTGGVTPTILEAGPLKDVLTKAKHPIREERYPTANALIHALKPFT